MRGFGVKDAAELGETDLMRAKLPEVEQCY